MTATERVRELLDERGVEWWETASYIGATITSEGIERHYLVSTWWNSPVFGRVEATDMGDGVLHMACLNGCDLTPEQAVEATLGRGMLTADDVRDLIERHSDASGGNGRDFHNGAYVAIADELNASLGSCNCSNSERTNGTCRDLGGTGANDEQVFNCSECGCVLSLYDRDGSNNLCTSFVFDYPRYCPECGRKVVDE